MRARYGVLCRPDCHTMPPPLIAHIVYRLDYGGLENGLINLINRLPREHSRHCVICLTEATDFRHRLRRPDVAVHELHKKPGKDPSAYFRLWRLLRSLRPAVVHTRNTGVIDCQVIAHLAAVPTRIHGYHGWDVDDLSGDNPRLHRLRKFCDSSVQHYVAVSRQIARWMELTLGISPERFSQIYNGVDTNRFQVVRSTAQLPTATGAFVIGSVGRLQAVKNQGLLVAACGRLCRERADLAPRVRLVIAGDGPDRDRLAAAIDAEGLSMRTVMPGWQDQVPELLAGLSVFVLPSLNEGISNTILEAMASSLPVIATEVGGNPELVRDGETGFLVPVGDPSVLAARLARYMDSPELAQRHGAQARAVAERSFSLDRMVADYDALYRRMNRLARAA